MSPRYTYRPTPPLAHWSEMRLLAIDVCNQIHEARWAEYGNLAKAYNEIVRRDGLGYGVMNAHTFGLLIDDHDERVAGELADWTVPWHRIRDHDGLLRAKYHGKVYDPDNYANERYHHEGGRLSGASAVPAQMVDMHRTIRRRRLMMSPIDYENTTTVSTEAA